MQTALCSTSRPFTHSRTPLRTQRPRVQPCVKTQAYVEASVTYAVTQQAIAYALVLGGDYYLERFRPDAPDVKIVGAGAGATMAAVAVLNTGVGALTGVGLVTGFLASGAMMAYHGKRTLDAKEQPDSDWPGPKALPATITLISFFALNVFLQGIRAEL
eukprot:CAMPEP_0202866514 /NCGR_PEP_ID=MMETSP1391-20130828/7807_1 /ASSEMBLY_ACC=CAM_ASM_000867 /TAXON_ID=1034604 /ORGANISM="Chlamydomonas leiostraca, Strain SAG 11-49" /LENGTH=158 /DNA_ID=CAMNT_0049546467 /DNA_START=44 /DNA_END=520 /DNA_ORIENTATION=+